MSATPQPSAEHENEEGGNSALPLSLAHTLYRFFIWCLSYLRPIKRTPVIRQMEATECGSICLSIILSHFGHHLSTDEVRETCGVSRDGSKASYILRGARSYNLIGHGYQIPSLEGLDECVMPCIIHWNFDHFVVLEGRRGNTFYINDPAYGRRQVPLREFDHSFTGIALTFERGEGFVKKRGKSGLSLFLRYGMKGSFFALIAAIVLGLLQILPNLAVAGATKGFLDYVFLQSLHHWTPPLALVIVGAIFFQMLVMLAQQRLMLRLQMHLKLSLASKIIQRLFYLPLSFFDQRFSGDILYRFSSLQQLTDLFSVGFMSAFVNFISFLVFGWILWIISQSLFFIVATFIVLRVFIFLIYKRPLSEKSFSYIQDSGRLSGIEMNGLQSIEMLKANRLEDVFFRNWAANHDDVLNKFSSSLLTEQQYTILLSLFAGLLPLCLLYKGSMLVMDNVMSIGTLMAFTSLANALDTPLMTLLEFLSSMERIKATISRLHDILLHQSKDADMMEGLRPPSTPTSRLEPLQTEITFHNLSFSYGRFDPLLFEDFNLNLPRGKITALVGSSGSGKSTLSKLLCGLYTLKEGAIFWDNLPLETVPSKDLSQHIALVDQDIFFFEGTVRDNLGTWNQNITDDAMIDALIKVDLYDTLIGRGLLNAPILENGINLSGGQRQRLEIARALLTKPSLFILDEGTSALDTVSERAIFNMLCSKDNPDNPTTLLIIAHRLSTLQHADFIHVIDQGKIIESGNHHDLIEKGGLYKTLFEKEALA